MRFTSSTILDISAKRCIQTCVINVIAWSHFPKHYGCTSVFKLKQDKVVAHLTSKKWFAYSCWILPSLQLVTFCELHVSSWSALASWCYNSWSLWLRFWYAQSIFSTYFGWIWSSAFSYHLTSSLITFTSVINCPLHPNHSYNLCFLFPGWCWFMLTILLMITHNPWMPTPLPDNVLFFNRLYVYDLTERTCPNLCIL